MFTVTLDTEAVAEQMGNLAYNVLQKAVDVLGKIALTRIQDIISAKIKDGDKRANYIKSVITEREETKLTIRIDDPKISGLELGFSSFDIKPGLLKGPKVKHGKEGPYQDVPFEHKITKRGKGTFIEAKGMQSMVRKAISKVGEGGVPERLFTRQKGAPATNLSDMLVQQSRTEPGKVVAQTFRRVSENSDSSLIKKTEKRLGKKLSEEEKKSTKSWIHPGYEGVKAFEETVKYIETIKDSTVQTVIDEYFK
jgi:hypothetical protein